MAFFRLEPVDRQHQRLDIPVDLCEPFRGLLSGLQDRLVQAYIGLDGIVRQLNVVRVLSLQTKLGH